MTLDDIFGGKFDLVKAEPGSFIFAWDEDLGMMTLRLLGSDAIRYFGRISGKEWLPFIPKASA